MSPMWAMPSVWRCVWTCCRYGAVRGECSGLGWGRGPLQGWQGLPPDSTRHDRPCCALRLVSAMTIRQLYSCLGEGPAEGIELLGKWPPTPRSQAESDAWLASASCSLCRCWFNLCALGAATRLRLRRATEDASLELRCFERQEQQPTGGPKRSEGHPAGGCLRWILTGRSPGSACQNLVGPALQPPVASALFCRPKLSPPPDTIGPAGASLVVFEYAEHAANCIEDHHRPGGLGPREKGAKMNDTSRRWCTLWESLMRASPGWVARPLAADPRTCDSVEVKLGLFNSPPASQQTPSFRVHSHLLLRAAWRRTCDALLCGATASAPRLASTRVRVTRLARGAARGGSKCSCRGCENCRGGTPTAATPHTRSCLSSFDVTLYPANPTPHWLSLDCP